MLSSDKRFNIRCNSNGFEPTLEKYRDIDQRLIYNSFDSNKGMHANAKYLLERTTARFCMLLSDEDRVSPSELSSFLDFLEELDSCVSVVSCSIYDSVKDGFYFLPHARYKNSYCDVNLAAAFSLVPSYMSGLTFRTRELHSLNLDDFTEDVPGNVYGHLDIMLNLLGNDSKLTFYYPKFILKGSAIEYGGDSYSHRVQGQYRPPGCLDLNPSIYGPYARVRQFLYQVSLIYKIKNNLDGWAYFLSISNKILTFSKIIRNSHSVVVLSKQTSPREDIRRGFFDSADDMLIMSPALYFLIKTILLGRSFIAASLLLLISLLSRWVGKQYLKAKFKDKRY